MDCNDVQSDIHLHPDALSLAAAVKIQFLKGCESSLQRLELFVRMLQLCFTGKVV